MRRSDTGFSLVELMISMIIGLMIVLGIMSVYQGSEASRSIVAMLSEVQGNGRIALKWIKHDLRLAGSAAGVYNPSRIRSTTVPGMRPTSTGDCLVASATEPGWGLALLPSATGRTAPPVIGLDDVDDADEAFSGCVSASDYLPGSDVLSVHYADPEPVAPSELTASTIYLDAGIGGGVLFRCTVDGAACYDALSDARTDPSGTTLHQLVSRLYFVRRWSREPDDGVPALVRVRLESNGDVVQEPLIEGVTDLQIAYGLDSDGNGTADRRVDADGLPAPGSGVAAAVWNQVVSVHASLLLQSVDGHLRGGTTPHRITVGERSVEIEQGHVGKVFSTTVALRNPRSRVL